jgi:hypothetical protein
LEQKVMTRFTCIGFAFVLLSLCGANDLQAQSPTSAGGGTQPQATYHVPTPVQPNQIVDVIRAAKPKLEEINCCNYSLGFLVSRYHQGLLQIVGLGNWEGKDWFRVSFGGGEIIVGTIDNL